jgi:hypothetical protein
MFPKALTIAVTSAAEEALVGRASAMARDLDARAQAAPDGPALDRCEGAAVEEGRASTRQAPEQAVEKRLEAARKKGRRYAAVAADRPASTKAAVPGRSGPAWANCGRSGRLSVAEPVPEGDTPPMACPASTGSSRRAWSVWPVWPAPTKRSHRRRCTRANPWVSRSARRSYG